jgi:uncharacterized protein YfaP (DUF2135 family)
MKLTALIPCAAALLAVNAIADVGIDFPLGGWRHTAGDSSGFRQHVNYPASSVNLDGQPLSAQIRGHIAKTAKSSKPAQLIVNGVAMPLRVDGNGNFARPYTFGSGTNSIEVRSNEGERRRVSFVDSYGGRPQVKLRIVLSWDADGTDLDLHVVSPDGQHVFYGARTADNGGALDVDVTTGYGPEIYANPSPPPGIYHVFVNYYGSGESASDKVITAQVAVISQENTLAERQQIFRIPMRKPGELTLVKSFVFP